MIFSLCVVVISIVVVMRLLLVLLDSNAPISGNMATLKS